MALVGDGVGDLVQERVEAALGAGVVDEMPAQPDHTGRGTDAHAGGAESPLSAAEPEGPLGQAVVQHGPGGVVLGLLESCPAGPWAQQPNAATRVAVRLCGVAGFAHIGGRERC